MQWRNQQLSNGLILLVTTEIFSVQTILLALVDSAIQNLVSVSTDKCSSELLNQAELQLLDPKEHSRFCVKKLEQKPRQPELSRSPPLSKEEGLPIDTVASGGLKKDLLAMWDLKEHTGIAYLPQSDPLDTPRDIFGTRMIMAHSAQRHGKETGSGVTELQGGRSPIDSPISSRSYRVQTPSSLL